MKKLGMPRITVVMLAATVARPNQSGSAGERRLLDLAPEFVQARHALFGRIAGDQRGVDGADRGADDPVGLDPGFVQRLVNADLVGAEGAAALQHQDNLSRQCGLAVELGGAVAPGV